MSLDVQVCIRPHWVLTNLVAEGTSTCFLVGSFELVEIQILVIRIKLSAIEKAESQTQPISMFLVMNMQLIALYMENMSLAFES